MSPSDAFLDSRDFGRIARSIHFIEAHFREQPRLAAIAGDAGLSEFHFNRLFRRWAGLTPKQYLAFVTGHAAKAVLDCQPSVLETAYAVGLSGPGRLHDLVVSLEAMTPGELKAGGSGVLIRYGFSATPFGCALVGITGRGVCHLSFIEPGRDSGALRVLKEQWPAARLQRDDAVASATAVRIWGRGEARTVLSVAVAGTNFQLKVWQALIDLGGRGTTTYGDIAAAIGSESASRAVGNAVGANPVAWLIPCHQVLRRDGALGGYHWGADRKRAMLAWNALCQLQPEVGQKPVNRGLRA
jgi:AraC family transcriptional regulator, regulatory protein of adaptative response / methylated-DNA-[protein]-cysteine methyltransferase